MTITSIGDYKVTRSVEDDDEVFLARSPKGSRCHVRLLDRPDPDVAEESRQQIQLCAALDHPAVGKVHDLFEEGDRLAVVLESIDGATFDKLLGKLRASDQRLEPEAVWYLGHQIAGALAQAHAAETEDGDPVAVCHGHLSPRAIAIAHNGYVRLDGLGLAPFVTAGVLPAEAIFRPPEEAAGGRVTPRGDCYSFAMLLWTAIAGEPPRGNATIDSLGDRVPAALRDLLARALETNLGKRRVTSMELEHVLSELASPAGKASLAEAMAPLRRGAPAATASPAPTVRRSISSPGMRGDSARPVPALRSKPGATGQPPPRGKLASMPPAIDWDAASEDAKRPSIPPGELLDDLGWGGDEAVTEELFDRPVRAAKPAPSAPSQPRASKPAPSKPSQPRASKPARVSQPRTAKPARVSQPRAAMAPPSAPSQPRASSPTASAPSQPRAIPRPRPSNRSAPGSPEPPTAAPQSETEIEVKSSADVDPEEVAALEAAFGEDFYEPGEDVEQLHDDDSDDHPTTKPSPPTPEDKPEAVTAPLPPPMPREEPHPAPAPAPSPAPAPAPSPSPSPSPSPAPAPAPADSPWSDADAPPSVQTPPPARPLPLGMALAITLGTAAVVLVAGMWWMRRDGTVTEPVEPPATAASAPAPRASTRPAPRPTSRPALARSAAPRASAKPADDGKTGADLPPTDGYVIVHHPDEKGEVYFFNTKHGSVNQKLRVPCGTAFVRVGVTKPNGVAWLGEGQPLVVACQKVTELTLKPR